MIRRQLRRRQVLPFFKKLPPCLIGIEACATSHHWAREIAKLGHEVRLMPPRYVKPSATAPVMSAHECRADTFRQNADLRLGRRRLLERDRHHGRVVVKIGRGDLASQFRRIRRRYVDDDPDLAVRLGASGSTHALGLWHPLQRICIRLPVSTLIRVRRPLFSFPAGETARRAPRRRRSARRRSYQSH